MGVIDVVKTQTNQVVQKGQQAAQVGQSKVEAALAKRKADSLLRELGTAVYAQKTGRGDGAEVDRLIGELRSLEAQNASHQNASHQNASHQNASHASPQKTGPEPPPGPGGGPSGSPAPGSPIDEP